MIGKLELEKKLSYLLGQELATKIIDTSLVVEVEKNTEIVKDGQYIKIYSHSP